MRHELVIKYIRQAIQNCGEGNALAEVKRHLVHTLRMAEKAEDKKNKRDTQARFYAEEAKKRNERWMEMIKENLKKLQLPEIDNDQE